MPVKGTMWTWRSVRQRVGPDVPDRDPLPVRYVACNTPRGFAAKNLHRRSADSLSRRFFHFDDEIESGWVRW